jgi:ATP-binding protein involved in chromosome partitioning
MPQIDRETILNELKRIAAPDGRGNIVSADLISGLNVSGGVVNLAIAADPQRLKTMEQLRFAVEKAVYSIEGVTKATVVLTAEKAATPAAARGNAVEGVKYLIAVASGKGGVGKSTTAINLALALRSIGLSVAVLDADVYGPSMPKLFGLKGKPLAADAPGKKMKPMERFGVEVASIGFLVEEDTPMIWRGPMVMSALQQLLREVQWSPADVMVVDMPPGTGDAQLTLAQQTPLSGAVIVSTPQDLALIDARKGINMFKKVNVPLLGLVENMSYFTCTKCAERHDIFGHGGAQLEASKLGIPFLGHMPLDMEVRVRSDEGEPIVATKPDSELSKLYREMAEKIWATLSGGTQKRNPPKITIAD